MPSSMQWCACSPLACGLVAAGRFLASTPVTTHTVTPTCSMLQHLAACFGHLLWPEQL